MDAHGQVPRNRGDVTTLIGVLDVRGVRAMMTVVAGTETEVVKALLTRVLVRRLRQGANFVLRHC